MISLPTNATNALEALGAAMPSAGPCPWIVQYDEDSGCLIVAVKMAENDAVQKAIELLTNKGSGAGRKLKRSIDDLRIRWDALDGGNHGVQQSAITTNIDKLQDALKQTTGEEY